MLERKDDAGKCLGHWYHIYSGLDLLQIQVHAIGSKLIHSQISTDSFESVLWLHLNLCACPSLPIWSGWTIHFLDDKIRAAGMLRSLKC